MFDSLQLSSFQQTLFCNYFRILNDHGWKRRKHTRLILRIYTSPSYNACLVNRWIIVAPAVKWQFRGGKKKNAVIFDTQVKGPVTNKAVVRFALRPIRARNETIERIGSLGVVLFFLNHLKYCVDAGLWIIHGGYERVTIFFLATMILQKLQLENLNGGRVTWESFRRGGVRVWELIWYIFTSYWEIS